MTDFRHGKDTELWLAAADVSGYFNALDLSADVDTADTTVFKANWKTALTGAAGLATVGDGARLMSALTTVYAESSPVGGAVGFSWSVFCDGEVGFGVVLHPLVAVTGDANGTTHTGPVGGSTTGAIAHLHVTSVSAGDDITVTLEDSANGSDWLAISGGAFANLAVAGSERLVISGTIRRYTRAVWNVTGTDVSIVFGVALART